MNTIDPKADALLKKMSDYLGGLKAFTVDADHTTEVVRETGEKLQFIASSHVSVRRPDKLRSDRTGEVADLSFFYDGSTMTIAGRRNKLYAQAPAPPTLDAAIDCARDRFGLEAPGADLLYSSAYDVLSQGALSAAYVGPAIVNGVPTEHIAYREKDLDWQLWIKDGNDAVPVRYVITTRDVQGAPEFSVEFHDWNSAAHLPDDLFRFTPPKDFDRTELLTKGPACAMPK